ncbi:MAG TPA: hypothetical protein VF933_16985 [Streptosporangiaceae bacterium]
MPGQVRIVIVFLWDRRSSACFAELQQARKEAAPQWRAAPPRPPAMPRRRS